MCLFSFKVLKFKVYVLHTWRDMDLTHGFNSKMIEEDLCLVDSATTHTILKDKKYFQNLTLIKAKVNTISSSSNIIEGSGRANFMLPKGIRFCVDNALYASKSRRNLLSFKDIRSMVIILKPIMKAVKNIFILLQWFQARSSY